MSPNELEKVAREVIAHRLTRQVLDQLREPLEALLANEGIDRTSCLNGSRLAEKSANAVTGYKIRNDWTPELQVCVELYLTRGGAELRLAAYEPDVRVALPDTFRTVLDPVHPSVAHQLYMLKLSWEAGPDEVAAEILRSLPLMRDTTRRRFAQRGQLFMEQLYEAVEP